MKVNPLLEARHQTSGLNNLFNGDGLTFANYVTLNRNMIATVRAHDPRLNQIVDGNSPFALQPSTQSAVGHTKPYRRGILLTHGLTDSPYSMHHLAKFFQQQGFRVLGILLPGHGTQPGDTLEVRWQEWAKAVAYGTDQLAKEADEIFLGGYSAGGVLTLNQSLHDPRVRGLFLFSPALKISSRAARANWHKIYSWLKPTAKWISIKPDTDIYKYESSTKNIAAQLYALIKQFNRQWAGHPLNIPIFTVASQDDATADSTATVDFMARATHPLSKLVLYTTDPSQSPPGIAPEKLELVNSHLPDQKILSSAHTAVVLAPNDAHYGHAGDYCNCIHYYPDEMDKYQACNRGDADILQGEISAGNLKSGILRRLMVNPNFAALEISMKKFIERLG
ncbi:MAG: alpha/beta fold hydrolase [Gallionellaceae bacterium]|nr:alpha/beta fold hydrolase [Gallionellaceae bacterium]